MAVATGGEGFILGLKLYWLKFFNFGIDKYQLLILTLANQIASQLPETWDGVSNPVKVKGVNASQNILYIYVNNWEHLKLWIQSQLRVSQQDGTKKCWLHLRAWQAAGRWGERGEEISADTGTESSCPILDAVSLLTAFPTHTTTKQFQFKAPRQLVIKGRKQSGKTWI